MNSGSGCGCTAGCDVAYTTRRAQPRLRASTLAPSKKLKKYIATPRRLGLCSAGTCEDRPGTYRISQSLLRLE
ncbi:hypothetical protein TRAPUB_2541 [Trametes pubescens]|uniref:Uncharacterized protein n=1 Tax=Trametes pubescens TaxID=154538 RepID=A0A1M2VG81_TRAPU|nr:hypothetical protein TRAPUB_2541 [Trametes pubescens]